MCFRIGKSMRPQRSFLLTCILRMTWHYPSGHANAGYTIAIVLAQMVPEKRAEIFARAQAFALNRVIGGVHFRSDIEAGRLSGTLIAAAMFRQRTSIVT